MIFRRDPGTSETGRQGVSATRLRHDLRLPRVSAYGLSRVRRRGRRVWRKEGDVNGEAAL